jgi:hypothetical protein
MRASDEMSMYLQDLIDHERCCEVEDCPLCQSAQNVYRLARNLIFAEVVYPDVTLAAKSRVAQPVGAAATAAAGVCSPRAA